MLCCTMYKNGTRVLVFSMSVMLVIVCSDLIHFFSTPIHFTKVSFGLVFFVHYKFRTCVLQLFSVSALHVHVY